MLKGTTPLKINVKGTLHLNWVLKGQFHDIFWSMWIKYFLGLQPLLGHFGPILGLENNFWPYFVHFLTNLVKKNSGPKITFSTLLALENIFWQFFGHFLTNLAKIFFRAQNHFWTSLSLENNFWPYFGNFLTNLVNIFSGSKIIFGTFSGLENKFWPFFEQFGWIFFWA